LGGEGRDRENRIVQTNLLNGIGGRRSEAKSRLRAALLLISIDLVPEPRLLQLNKLAAQRAVVVRQTTVRHDALDPRPSGGLGVEAERLRYMVLRQLLLVLLELLDHDVLGRGEDDQRARGNKVPRATFACARKR